MNISKDTAKRMLGTLRKIVEEDSDAGKKSREIVSRFITSGALDISNWIDRIDIDNHNCDADIPDDKLIFRTSQNGKVYAINSETGDTSGLGKGIDNSSGSETISREKWKGMSDHERLSAKHPKNTKREGHKPKSDSIRWGNIREFEAMVAKDTGSSPEEAHKMTEGLRHYAGATYTYHDVRVASRVGSEDEYTGSKGKRRVDYQQAKEWADGVEAYIDSAPVFDGGPLTRGVSDKHNPLFAKELFDKAKEAMDNDSTIDMNGFSSWSTDDSHASEFGDDCYMLDLDEGVIPSLMYVLPKTYQGVSVDHFNEDIVESEVLISKKARFRPTRCYISKKYGSRGSYVVELEEV